MIYVERHSGENKSVDLEILVEKSLFFGEVSDKSWESLNFLGDKETIIVYFPIWVQSRELVVLLFLFFVGTSVRPETLHCSHGLAIYTAVTSTPILANTGVSGRTDVPTKNKTEAASYWNL